MSKVYAKYEIIFRQGDEASCMYEVLSGSVGIFANYGADNEKLLTTLTVGKTFGEMGLIDNLPRSATAVAMEENVRLQTITANSFAEYFQNNPGKVLSVMKHMSGRIRGLTHDYLDACRAVAESEEAAKTGKKSSWLKDHVRKFLQDYNDAASYLAKNPDASKGLDGYHDHYML